jgi:hypothetical protein
MTSIDARPGEATDRAVPGHWEGDLMIGKAGKTAMGTLVERTSRCTVAVALPAGRRDATTTCNALVTTVEKMPTALVKTLTWDQGSELAAHAAFTLATTVDVYFAHPHPGNAGRTRTRTGCSASTSPKAPTSPTTRPTSTSSPLNSTTGHAVSSTAGHQQKSSPTS